MNTKKLERFAQYARRYLLEQVGRKLDMLLKDTDLRRRNPVQVKQLEEELQKTENKESLIDKVAYTWFNRFCALRYMDVKGYNRINILSPLPGQFQPEILAEAKMGHIDPNMVSEKNRNRVNSLLSGNEATDNPHNEAYRTLVLSVCNYYAAIMPFLFERVADWTELLMPDDLLSGSSVIAFTREALTPDVCKDVEVIGWLYQYYISEKKDEIFAGLKKNRKIETPDIGPATQLFTPDWIVRYMVQNSLGRLWLRAYPHSALREKMEYYIDDDENCQTGANINRLEDIKLCDPCCGSGHILTYSFDLLYHVYEEQGYSPVSIPELIIKNNLYGIEIDERAGELAAFALTMKAREKDKLWFNKKIEPHICTLKNITFSDEEIESYIDKCGDDIFTGSLNDRLNLFADAETYGSLIVPKGQDVDFLKSHLDDKLSGQVFYAEIHNKINALLLQSDYLSPKYDVVVTNPPYMGSKGMSQKLGDFVKHHYPLSKSDLFAAFIERCLDLTLSGRYCALVTMQSWMFLSSYEKLRHKLLDKYTIESLVHMDNMVMRIAFGTSATIWHKVYKKGYGGAYCYVEMNDLDSDNKPRFFPPINNRNIKAHQTI